MTGDPIDAQHGARVGPRRPRSCRRTRCSTRAQELAAIIATRPPIAVETAKANLRAAYTCRSTRPMRYERDLQTICFATEDAAEGRAAFAEKRPGIFHGR